MAIDDNFPATARIVELQLAVATVNFANGERPLNGKRAPGPGFTEAWRGQIAFAPMNAADHRAFVAYLESLDGRVNPFALRLKGGFASQAVAASATVATAPPRGAGSISVTFGAAVSLLPGTLIALGDYTSSTFQLVELLDAATGSGTQTLNIAPRIRKGFSVGAAVSFGTVKGVFTLAGDTLAQSATLDHGAVTLDVIEAL
jgi:hypothetical protein